MTDDEKFLEEVMKAMLSPLSNDPDPCCFLWGKALHHHWNQRGEVI